MSMRTLVLLMGLILIGSAEALAVGAPLTASPSPADSREDLFASKPGSAVRSPVPVAPPAVAPAATSHDGPVPGGNPLWGIPVSRLTATREHPLFAPTRRPPPVAAVVAPAAPPVVQPPKPVEPDKPQLSLLGTIAGSRLATGVALFMDSSTKAVLRLKAGDNHRGWTLRAVRPRQVELARGLDSAVLELPIPEMKPGAAASMAAAPAPMPALAAMPAAPAGVSSAKLPIGPLLPINATMGPGGLPSGNPAGAPGIPTPTFKPPPPQINQFGNNLQR